MITLPIARLATLAAAATGLFLVSCGHKDSGSSASSSATPAPGSGGANAGSSGSAAAVQAPQSDLTGTWVEIDDPTRGGRKVVWVLSSSSLTIRQTCIDETQDKAASISLGKDTFAISAPIQNQIVTSYQEYKVTCTRNVPAIQYAFKMQDKDNLILQSAQGEIINLKRAK